MKNGVERTERGGGLDDFGHVEEEEAGKPAPEYQLSDSSPHVEEKEVSPHVEEEEKADDFGHVEEEEAGKPAPEYQLLDSSPHVEKEDVSPHVEKEEEADDFGHVEEEEAGKPAPEYQLSNSSPHVEKEEVSPHVEEVKEAGPSGIQTTRKPLSLDSFDFHQLLGKGSFGKVYLATHRADNQELAIKMVKKRPFMKKRCPSKAIFRERQTLKTLRKGPFITQLFGTFQSEDYLYFVMEYLRGGTLRSILNVVQKPLRLATLRMLAAQMLVGLEYIHSKGIIHRDIKPDNILIDGLGNTRIADFGVAAQNVFEKDMVRRKVGTLYYMTPEMVKGLYYNHSVDYFAMGITLYEMTCSKRPLIETTYKGDMASVWFPSWMNLMLKEFLQKLLCKCQIRRTKLVKNLRENPFFNQIDWKDVESGKALPPFRKMLPQEEPKVTTPAVNIILSEAKRIPRIPAEQQKLFRSFSFATEGW
ncbi:protein kinase C theta type-like [Hyperolius riggenbachi]|uniref:protein kinase C theta type-like n=1 Tax=Hyperolius riggenbachi TaxID=752182 RepID=UPI0035A3619F